MSVLSCSITQLDVFFDFASCVSCDYCHDFLTHLDVFFDFASFLAAASVRSTRTWGSGFRVILGRYFAKMDAKWVWHVVSDMCVSCECCHDFFTHLDMLFDFASFLAAALARSTQTWGSGFRVILGHSFAKIDANRVGDEVSDLCVSCDCCHDFLTHLDVFFDFASFLAAALARSTRTWGSGFRVILGRYFAKMDANLGFAISRHSWHPPRQDGREPSQTWGANKFFLLFSFFLLFPSHVWMTAFCTFHVFLCVF